jgi:hypothetical protein
MKSHWSVSLLAGNVYSTNFILCSTFGFELKLIDTKTVSKVRQDVSHDLHFMAFV